jgi:hypothetical protein
MAGVVAATAMSARRLTRSLARSGRLSSAHRYSITTFWPSTQPRSRKPTLSHGNQGGGGSSSTMHPAPTHGGSIAIVETLKALTSLRDRVGNRRERREGLLDRLTVVVGNPPAPARLTRNREGHDGHRFARRSNSHAAKHRMCTWYLSSHGSSPSCANSTRELASPYEGPCFVAQYLLIRHRGDLDVQTNSDARTEGLDRARCQGVRRLLRLSEAQWKANSA